MAACRLNRAARVLAGLATMVALVATAHAQVFDAVVTRVSDGDSVRVQPVDGGPPRVLRLLGMDAPETCQRHGPQAREALAGQVQGQRVRVHATTLDRYQRLLARLETAQEPDVGAWMVVHGHAWSYRWRDNPGPYAQEQAEARQAHRGLWAGATPQEPRAFRREHGPCH